MNTKESAGNTVKNKKTSHEIRVRRDAVNHYLYGVTLTFEADGRVTFTAPLVPSGKVLYVWKSETSYQNERREPSLPLLKTGVSYRLSFFCESRPERTVLFRLAFYNRFGEALDALVTDEDTMTFVCPADAYRCELELKQGGFDSLVFDRAVLEECIAP